MQIVHRTEDAPHVGEAVAATPVPLRDLTFQHAARKAMHLARRADERSTFPSIEFLGLPPMDLFHDPKPAA